MNGTPLLGTERDYDVHGHDLLAQTAETKYCSPVYGWFWVKVSTIWLEKSLYSENDFTERDYDAH